MSVRDNAVLCAYAEGACQADAGIRYLLEECKAVDSCRE